MRLPAALRHHAVVPGFALLVAGLLAACGGDALPSLSPSPTPVPLPTPVTTSFAPGATAWYAGLIVHIDGAVAVVDASGGTVALDMRLENPGSDLASLEAPLMLISGSDAVDPVRGTVLPDIPGGSTASTTVVFEVDGAFDLGAGAVRIGRAAEHEVVVPLAADTAGLITLEPRALAVRGSVQAGTLRIVVSAGELRADLPDWGLELPRSSVALTLTYSATFRSDFAGGFAFTGANVSLVLPDGRTIAARPDGHSAPAQVLRPGAVVTGLVSRFEVPAPGTGAYTLVITNGSAIGKRPFIVKAP
jgi:hypothetical protein